MTQQTTIDMLRGMKMSAMATELEKQLGDPAFRELGFEDRLCLLVNAEWNRRQSNKVERLIRTARFSAPFSCVEEIEYHEDRHLDKAEMLRLSTCNYVNEGRHIILKGASGNGKTYIACALGNAACRRFKTVRYMRMPELLGELSIKEFLAVQQFPVELILLLPLLDHRYSMQVHSFQLMNHFGETIPAVKKHIFC